MTGRNVVPFQAPGMGEPAFPDCGVRPTIELKCLCCDHILTVTHAQLVGLSKRTRDVLTHERLLSLLHFDPGTGVFTWKVDRTQKARAGSVAGSLNAYGYVIIHVSGRRYQAQRLAWFYMIGKWPTHLVDHRDRRRANNAWRNLREANRSENGANSDRVKADGLPRGVTLNPGSKSTPYRARIKVQGQQRMLGAFATIAEAHAAYLKAAHEAFGDFMPAQLVEAV